MTSKPSARFVVLAAMFVLPFSASGQGVVTNLPPLPTLSITEKERLSSPDLDASKRLQAIWQDKQAKYVRLTNGPIESIIVELHQPVTGTEILWQHMPQAKTNEINTFRRGWLVWWPDRFDVDYGLLFMEPQAAIDRAAKASLFKALLYRDPSCALAFLSGQHTNNPPTLQQASYAKVVLEYQPISNLFTTATAPLWRTLLDSENPLLLGMALQIAPERITKADLEVALRRAIISDWVSLKYLAVEAVAALPMGVERDELMHVIEPLRQIDPPIELIREKFKEMEDAQHAPPVHPSGH